MVRNPDGFEARGTPYAFKCSARGERLIYPDKTDLSAKRLRLPQFPLLTGLTPVLEDNAIKWRSAMFDVTFGLGKTGEYCQVVFKQPLALPGELKFNCDPTGLDIAALLAAKEGLGIPAPRLIDSSEMPVERMLKWIYKNGQLQVGLDFSGLKFPVTYQNSPLDLQVGASADDGYSSNIGGFDSTDTVTVTGYTASHTSDSFHRFLNLSMSGTIDTAYIQLRRNYYGGAPSLKVSCDDSATPTAPTNRATHAAKVRTSANATWNPADPGNFLWTPTGTPEIKSVIQELVDSYTYDGDDAVQVFLDDLKGTGENVFTAYSWNYFSGPSSCKLHIEYTAGGATLVAVSDSLAMSDVSKLKRYWTGVDTLALTEAAKVKAILSARDSVTLSEQTSLKVKVPAADTLSMTEQTSLRALLRVPDTLTLTETMSLKASFAITDSLSLTETEAVKALLSVTDGLTVTDLAHVPLHILRVPESLTLAEAMAIRASLTVSDLLTLTDVAIPKLFKSVADFLTLTEAANVRAFISVTEALALTEAPFRLRCSLTVADALALTEFTAFKASLVVTDALVLTASLRVPFIAARIVEPLSMTDVVALKAMLAVVDSLTMTDAINWRVVLSITDSLTLTEALRVPFVRAAIIEPLTLTVATRRLRYGQLVLVQITGRAINATDIVLSIDPIVVELPADVKR